MPEVKTQLTDSQKLDAINKRVKRMEASTHVQTFIMVIGFIGILSLSAAVAQIKKII